MTRVIGAGGMGVVLEAEHLELGDRVAIKVLAAAMSVVAGAEERFRREALAARRIESPHAVKVFDFGRLGSGAPYLVMELLEGEDLRHHLERRGKLSVREAAGHVARACEAIAEAHREGIVHRDIKAENLYLARDRRGGTVLKVLDFGIAKVARADADDPPALTRMGSVIGTPSCMSPEQLRADEDVDARTDIWSLGVVLYELVTGRCPFEGHSFVGVIVAVLKEAVVAPSVHEPSVPAAFDAIVLRCLEKDRERRFPTVDALRSALEGLLAAMGPEAAGAVSAGGSDGGRAPGRAQGQLSTPTLQSWGGDDGDESGATNESNEGNRPPEVDCAPTPEDAPVAPPVNAPLTPAITPLIRPPIPPHATRPIAPRAAAAWRALHRPSLALGVLAASLLTAGVYSLSSRSEHARSLALALTALGALSLIAAVLVARARFAHGKPSQLTRGFLGSHPASSSRNARPAPSPAAAGVTLPPALLAYLGRARLRVSRVVGSLHHLEPLPDSRVRTPRLAATSFDEPPTSASGEALSTRAPQAGAPQLLDVEGTADAPWCVLALVSGPLKAGVYRRWSELAARHVKVVPISPSQLADGMDRDPAEHLNDLLEREPRDPFELPGSVPDEVSEVEFFGGREVLQSMLQDLDRASPGLGVFGLSRWGVTSLLRRLRLELTEHVTLWVDLKALQDVRAAVVLGAILSKLRHALGLGAGDEMASPDSASKLQAAIVAIVRAHAAKNGAPIVLFLDHIDRLGATRREDNPDLLWIVRCLYGLLASEDRGPGLRIIVGGHDDSLFSRPSFPVAGHEEANPLWKCVRSYHVPFFTPDETWDFLSHVGGKAGLSFSAAAAREVHRLTGGHKYLTRRLGSLVFRDKAQDGRAGEAVDEADVARCGSLLREAEDTYFRAVRDHLPDAAQRSLTEMARRHHGSGATAALPERLGPSVSILSDYSLIRRDAAIGGYTPTIGLFCEWLRRETAITFPPAPALPSIARAAATPSEESSGPPSAILPHGTTFQSSHPPPPVSPRATVVSPSRVARPDIFIACARLDQADGRDLERRLAPRVERAGLHVWGDWKLLPGAELRDSTAALESASLFIVLLSQAFMDDRRCREQVMPRIRARVEARKARLVPVLLAPCDWASEPLLGERQPVPQDGHAIRGRRDRDETLLDVTHQISAVVDELFAVR